MSGKVHRLSAPVTRADLAPLEAGDRVLVSGTLYTARDTAHKRLIALLEAGEALPFEIKGAIIYYVGPSPARPGRPIGAAGPTTSYRMDAYTPRLLEEGLMAMIGKGKRSPGVREAMVEHGAVYLAAIGGAGALLGQAVRASRVVAFDDLGPEAVRELVVEDLPAIVINDPAGSDLYETGRAAYAKEEAK